MDEAQKAAYIMSQVACALAEIAGMQAENTKAMMEPNGRIQWGLEDFQNVPIRFGITHNDVIGYLTGR